LSQEVFIVSKRVLVPLAQGCEELEAVTIIDILRRGGLEVVTAGLDDALVKASRGTVLKPDVALDAVASESFDMVVLPGGMPGSEHLANDARILSILAATAQHGAYTCAICAAPMVLAKCGLLDGRRATSYPGVIDKMDIPGMTFTGAAVETDGKIVTSRGPGTALDFALKLVELLMGPEVLDRVSRGLVR
jgi:4-methyl-5(b-hydroxyethyl)-thiazole monophosphate biosynthesis